MSLSLDAITALAPDQASLKAANKLMKPGKWPLRASATGEPLVWGECQGSGANPYRAVFDQANHGYKCTCPSRKFPCKHVLALMWMYVEDPAPFAPAAVPDWVTDWLGRRRKPAGTAAAAPPVTSGAAKSLSEAKATEPPPPLDPKAEARRAAAAAKRARVTEAAMTAAVADLEQWMADQVRTGLSGLLEDPAPPCRAIAARMVDGKAGALASRLDEIPARVMALSGEDRLDALIAEFGKIVLLIRAWRAAPDDAELRRAIGASQTRESLIEDPDAMRVRSVWEVLGEQISTRRDGMVSQATWLLNLAEGPRFALLLDYFPASLGQRSGVFASGEQFDAEMVFYPARQPLRAVITDRAPSGQSAPGWPDTDSPDPLEAFIQTQNKAPWVRTSPLLLPDGRLCQSAGGSVWWQSTDHDHALPVANSPPPHLRGMALHRTAGLWDGGQLTLLAAQSDWGRVALDA